MPKPPPSRPVSQQTRPSPSTSTLLRRGEFANAARNTTSVEALRTLRLLEEHHRRLAELLKLPTKQVSQAGEDDENEKENHNEKDQTLSPSNRSQGNKKMPSLAQRKVAARDMSSSIASNLASARGIRSKYRGQPLSPSVSNDQAPGDLDSHPPRDGSRSKMQSIIETQPGKPTWGPANVWSINGCVTRRQKHSFFSTS